ncbi:MAG: hypothetical protein AAGA62_16915, partial [Bacteroidota bacterium]
TLKNIELQNDLSVLSTLYLSEEPRLPTDSRFEVNNIDIFGTPALSITPGTAEEFLLSGDTVYLSPSKSILFDTTLNKSLIDAASNWFGVDAKKDSILQELRELNRRLEDLQQIPQE